MTFIIDKTAYVLYNLFMNVNDVIELDILSNGMNGEGVARLNGKVVFVPYTLAGERVLAVVKQVKSKYANASVIKVEQKSPHRVEPECPHYYKCGGCDMRHIDAEYRNAVLINELKNNLVKIAGTDFAPSEIVSGNENNVKRNKLAMPFALADGKAVLGLYRQNTHVVEPVTCMLAGSLARKTAETVCKFANEKRLSVYNEKTGKGLLRHLVIREAGGRASATLVVNAQAFEGESELGKRLADNVDFFVCPNTARNNVIMGDAVRLVKGNARLNVDVLGVKAELSPLSFFQVNDEVRDKLYTAAVNSVVSDTLIDLYSGIGITSNLAANSGKSVIAVECVPQAVEDADRTALINGNAGMIRNICGDTERVLPTLDVSGECDVLLDPPRKGCGQGVMQAVKALSPRRIIYISCNHATMCRDIRVPLDDGYSITHCEVYDMFPCTHHCEVLCVLERAFTA